ncbi:MAG: DUF2231 domain-containing protein [Nitrospinales bacterium]
MFDLPLHPIVVHFPIVLGFIIPVASLLIWWGIKKNLLQQNFWAVIIAIVFVYGASALIAVEMGEKDEDKVEKVVAEKVIEEHEESGEMIPWVAGGLLLISFSGYYLKDSHAARLGFVILSIIAIIPLANAGHTGGKLVYQYGAAKAHMPSQNAGLEQITNYSEQHEGEEEEEENDDEDDD